MAFSFGASQPSLFGAPAHQQQQQQQQHSQPSLFGAPAQSQPSLFGGAGGGGGSLFGGAAQHQSQGSLFGGQPQQPQQQQPQQQSLFGGASQPQQQPQQQQSLFGGVGGQQSLFGGQSAPSLFANSQQPQQQQQLQVQSQSSIGSQFNSFFNVTTQQSAPSLFSSQPQQPQQPQQQQYSQLPASLLQLVERLNPLHPSSPFQAFLYNVVPPEIAAQYTRPPSMHSVLWSSAQADNPDPSRQVAVPANGFDDLLLRAQTQSARSDDHRAVLSSLSSQVSAMQDDARATLRTRLAAYRRRHRELARKLLRVAAAVDAAVSPHILTAPEQARRARVEAVAKQLSAPGEFKDKLCDLVEVARNNDTTQGGRVVVQKVPVTIRDRQAADAVRSLLSEQLNGIEQVGVVCANIDRDIAVMKRSIDSK